MIDPHGGSSVEALTDLLNAMAGKKGLWIYKNSNHTFHPKVFLFKNDIAADLLIGSGNLTKGGLFENVEVGVRVKLNLNKSAHINFLAQLEAILDSHSKLVPGVCLPLDNALISTLNASGELPTEREAHRAMNAANKALKNGSGKGKSPFSSVAIQKAPPIKSNTASVAAQGSSAMSGAATTGVGAKVPAVTPGLGIGKGQTFGITLQNTDVGVGQKTKGTSKRSPELFVPVAVIDANPAFWGWKSKAQPDMKKYSADTAWALKPNNAVEIAKIPTSSERPRDKLDWVVNVNLHGTPGLVSTTFWFNPIKKDLRMRAKILRGAGDVGDILLISQAPLGALYDYDMQVIPKASPQYSTYRAKLTNKVRGSKKEYAYF